MTVADYDQVYQLWTETEGLSLTEDDTPERIEFYLNWNAGLSFVATADGSIIGTVLGGHDGRLGWLRHLAVKKEFRGQDIAHALVGKSLNALADRGITKCRIFVLNKNADGFQFWKHLGWQERELNFSMLQIPTKSRE